MNNSLNLPDRSRKPRIDGITSLHDISLTTKELRYILEDYHEFIDFAKFGVGTAYIAPNLKRKIEIYKEFNIEVYFGGTLFEKFYSQGKLKEYRKFLDENLINTIEISCGTIDIDLEKRVKLVEDLKSHYMVLAEVGGKDSEMIMAPSIWINEIESLLNAGSSYVITEGRDSGTAGIFRADGEIRSGLLDDISRFIDCKKIIFEAPNTVSQMKFINKFGSNVNLANISPYDVLILEAQRQGLRSETFLLK